MDNNALCGLYYDDDGDIYGTYTAEGITALCDGLKGSAITSLRCAVTPRLFAFMSAPPDTPSHHTHTVTRSLHNNEFDDTTKTSLKEATSAKNGFELIL